MAFDANGNMIVVDRIPTNDESNFRLRVSDPLFQNIKTIPIYERCLSDSSKEKDAIEARNICGGLAIDKNQNIVIPNYNIGNCRMNKIWTFGQNSEVALGSIGPEYSLPKGGNAIMDSPSAVAVDVHNTGNLVVSDSDQSRILIVSPEGVLIRSFGSAGSADGHLMHPSRIAIDRKGNIVVADTLNGRIQIFSPQGKFLTKFGGRPPKHERGHQILQAPMTPLIDKEGNIWVIDASQSQIFVFG